MKNADGVAAFFETVNLGSEERFQPSKNLRRLRRQNEHFFPNSAFTDLMYSSVRSKNGHACLSTTTTESASWIMCQPASREFRNKASTRRTGPSSGFVQPFLKRRAS